MRQAGHIASDALDFGLDAFDIKDEPVELLVDFGDCPIRLDVYLAGAVADLSRARVQHLIRMGKVLVDGTPGKPSLKLGGGEKVVLVVPPVADAKPQPEAIPLEILYEDSDLLVINKPAGMVVHPGAGTASGTLVNALLHHCGDLSGIGGVARPGIVHRLDRQTSGCICVAKNDFAHQRLSAQLADRSMSRTYVAWVIGEMAGQEGRIDLSIGRSTRNPTQMAVVGQGGRHAVTHWRVAGRAPGLTRLLCRLETGRTHQIRVHLSHLGYPIVGDAEYGIPAREAKQRIPAGNPRIVQAVVRAPHQMLHAWRLRFRHPRRGEFLEFEASFPAAFLAFEDGVGKAEGRFG